MAKEFLTQSTHTTNTLSHMDNRLVALINAALSNIPYHMSLPVDQQRFLLPFTEPSDMVTAALRQSVTSTAAKNLALCIESQSMPVMSDVGLLKDDAKLLKYIDEIGTEWLKNMHALYQSETNHVAATGLGNQEVLSEIQSAAYVDFRRHLQRLIHGTAFISTDQPTPACSPVLAGDVDDALKYLHQFPSAACRLVAARLLFRFRVTIGTVTAVGILGFSLPSKTLLLRCFQTPHCPPREVIHVGARALAKHIHRDNSLSWWGNHHLTGSQAKKNAAADDVLERIMVGCESTSGWRNFHVLPHGFVVYEIRVPEGYGARWQLDTKPRNVLPQEDQNDPLQVEAQSDISAEQQSVPNISPDALTFRGFLEPHDLQGHANAWKH